MHAPASSSHYQPLPAQDRGRRYLNESVADQQRRFDRHRGLPSRFRQSKSKSPARIVSASQQQRTKSAERPVFGSTGGQQRSRAAKRSPSGPFVSSSSSSGVSNMIPVFPIASPYETSRGVTRAESVEQSSAAKVDWVREFLCLSAREVAEHLTVTDLEVLKAITCEELRTGAWQTVLKHERAPNIVQHVHRFNMLTVWVENVVLASEQPQIRANCLHRLLKIARELKQIHSYNALGAIVLGLGSAPISRLTKTWKHVRGEELRFYREQSQKYSGSDHNQAIKTEMENLMRGAGIRQGMVPYLNGYLQDLSYVLENAKTTDSFKAKADQIIMCISEFQRVTLQDKRSVEVVAQYFSKCPHAHFVAELQKFVEDQNYRRSLELEPDSAATNTPQKLAVCLPPNHSSPNFLQHSSVSNLASNDRPDPSRNESTKRNLMVDFSRPKSHHKKANSLGSRESIEGHGYKAENGDRAGIKWMPSGRSGSLPNYTKQVEFKPRNLIDDSIIESTSSQENLDSIAAPGGMAFYHSGAVYQTSLPTNPTSAGFTHSHSSHSALQETFGDTTKGDLLEEQDTSTDDLPPHAVISFAGPVQRKCLAKDYREKSFKQWRVFWLELLSTQLNYFESKKLIKFTGKEQRELFKKSPYKTVDIAKWTSSGFSSGDSKTDREFRLSGDGNVYVFRVGTTQEAERWLLTIGQAQRQREHLRNLQLNRDLIGTSCDN